MLKKLSVTQFQNFIYNLIKFLNKCHSADIYMMEYMDDWFSWFWFLSNTNKVYNCNELMNFLLNTVSDSTFETTSNISIILNIDYDLK